MKKIRVEVLRQQQNKKFSDIANLYIETKEKPEWTNPKSEQQWRNTINTYVSPILDSKPLNDINRDDIINVFILFGEIKLKLPDVFNKDYSSYLHLPKLENGT